MPCRNYDSEDERRATQLNQAESLANSLTQMLCEACQAVERHRHFDMMSGELQKWWKAHKAQDKRREGEKKEKIERQNLKSRALKKLTSEEKKALGL